VATFDDGLRVRPIPIEDDGPRVRLIPIEDAEKVARIDSRPGDRADEEASGRPWLFIGQRFVEGCPYPDIMRR
jgi:hypothetical protein